MNPIEAVVSVFSNYFNFSDRARRSEYWWFQLIFSLFFFPIYIYMKYTESFTALLISLIILIILMIPTLAVSVRRLHDIGKSGWIYLINLLPLGSLVLLYFFVQDSEEGENEYGPNPKKINGYE